MYIENAKTLGSSTYIHTYIYIYIGLSDCDLAAAFSFRHETHSFLQINISNIVISWINQAIFF